MISIQFIGAEWYGTSDAANFFADGSWRKPFFAKWRKAVVLGYWPEEPAREVYAFVKQHFPLTYWVEIDFNVGDYLPDGIEKECVKRYGYRDDYLDLILLYDDAARDWSDEDQKKLDSFMVHFKLRFS